MTITTAIGTPIYLLSHRLIRAYQIDDLKDPTGSLFRDIGMLVSLMLSLAFADVIVKKNTIENAVMREAAAISDAIVDLQSYGTEQARNISLLLVDYTIAVVDDDWPALANDELSEITRNLGSQISEQVLQLTPGTQKQERLLAGIQADVDAISDYRISRLAAALAHPPVFVYVVLIGFFLTMACFGAYRPQRPLVVLISIYAAFVGFVLYLILSLSDPFQGAFSVQHSLFDVVIKKAEELTGQQG